MDQNFIQNPYPTYVQNAKQGDVYWDQHYRSWCVMGYDAAIEAMMHPQLSSDISTFLSSTTFPTKARKEVQPLVDFFQQWMFYLDPPKHTQLRQQLSPAFSQKKIAEHQSEIMSITAEVCGSQKGTFDFSKNIAHKVAPRVLANMLNLPQKDAPQLVAWTLELVDFLDAFVRTKKEYQPALKAMHEMQQYFSSDWVLNAMLVATGIETTMSFLPIALYTLLKHPDQWALLNKQPELVDQAVNELLRFEPPVHLNVRRAKENLLFYEHEIKQGDIISIFLASANRDARKFSHPNQLDITRKKNPHLSFGYGIHYCLGRLLGHSTTRACIAYILENWPRIQLANEDVSWVMGTSLRQLESLSVVID